jgi:hypothetical protein
VKSEPECQVPFELKAVGEQRRLWRATAGRTGQMLR